MYDVVYLKNNIPINSDITLVENREYIIIDRGEYMSTIWSEKDTYNIVPTNELITEAEWKENNRNKKVDEILDET